MSVIYILIPIALLFTGAAIYLFFWAVKTEQFDDLEKQGMSILFDDEPNDRKSTLKSAPNDQPSIPTKTTKTAETAETATTNQTSSIIKSK